METLVENLFRQLADLPAWGQFLATALATAFGEVIAALSIWSLARNGTLPWSVATLGVFTGAWVAHVVPWVIGRSVGARALNWNVFRTLRENGTLEQARRRINRRGWIILGISRFLPGVRLAVYLLSGILNVPPAVFLPVLTGITLVWMAGTLGMVQVAATLLESLPIPTLVGACALLAGLLGFRLRREQKAAALARREMEAEPVV